jgi:hypothetical protein
MTRTTLLLHPSSSPFSGPQLAVFWELQIIPDRRSQWGKCLLVEDALFSHRLNTGDLSSSLLGWLRHIILHERESQDLLDRVMVSQEHNKAIDTAAPSTGWW